MDIRLVVEAGPDAGQEFRLRRGVVTAGRSPDNSIALDDIKVSRWHAEIRWQDDVFVIRDLDSRNGTFVNDLRLTVPQVLRPGDQVRLGDTYLIVQGGRKSVRPSDWIRRGRRGYEAWEEIQEERERASREGQPQAKHAPRTRLGQFSGAASSFLTTGATLPFLVAAGAVALIIALVVVLTRGSVPFDEQGRQVGEHFIIIIDPPDPDPEEAYRIRIVTRPPVPDISIKIEVSGTDGFHCVDSGTTNETGSVTFPTTGSACDVGGRKAPGAEEGVTETIRVIAPELDQEETFVFIF